MAFSDDLHFFAELSGTEDVFELWEAKHFSVVSIFDDKDVRHSFPRARTLNSCEQQPSQTKHSGTL